MYELHEWALPPVRVHSQPTEGQANPVVVELMFKYLEAGLDVQDIGNLWPHISVTTKKWEKN